MTAAVPETLAALPPSEEAPVYRKITQRRDDGTASSLCLIACDEGWRSTILCSGVYDRDADFLLSLLGRKSRLPSVREHEPDFRALYDEARADAQRSGDLVTELRRRIKAMERAQGTAR